MNQPFRPVGQSGTSFQVVRGADGDIDHPRTGKRRHVVEGVEHLRTTGDYLGFPSVGWNMKTFCGFLRVGITWFLVTLEFWEEMDVEFSAGYIFDKLLIDPWPARENITRSTKGDGIALTSTSWRRWSSGVTVLF